MDRAPNEPVRCPVCGSPNPTRYLMCNRPDCTDGRHLPEVRAQIRAVVEADERRRRREAQSSASTVSPIVVIAIGVALAIFGIANLRSTDRDSLSAGDRQWLTEEFGR